MKPEIINALFAIGGALIGAGSSFLTTWINKRSEDRRHVRALMVSAAIENWKHSSQLLMSNKVPFLMPPLAGYLVSMTTLGELCINSNLNEKNAKNRIDELIRLTNIVEKHIQDNQRTKS